MSLRDELAAVLGPGNDDAVAYAQADAVLQVLARHGAVVTRGEAEVLGVLTGWHIKSTGAIALQGRGGEVVDLIRLAEQLFDAAPDRSVPPGPPPAGLRPWQAVVDEEHFHVDTSRVRHPDAVLDAIRRVAEDSARLVLQREQRDQAVLQGLRGELLGFTGRLEDGRLHVTSNEAAILREHLDFSTATGAEGFDLTALQIVVDDGPQQ